jgi:hypothetical protein
MPMELRERIAEAAAREGRSFNAEVVHRLEQSLESPAGRIRAALPWNRVSLGEAGMQRNRWRVAVGALLVGSLVLVAAVTGSSRLGSKGSMPLMKQGDPDAVGASYKTIIGPENRSPDSAAAQDALERAYPADTVPVQLIQSSQQDFKHVKARGKRGKEGNWELIGPSKATYPGVLNVLGDGAEYVTSGRVTGLALAPGCDNRRCTLYAAAAGGGIWRTDKALAKHPDWTFVSGSFATNAIGTLLIDPNDPSGRTLYAGTGEPNASADSEAGVGIYKSTDGGTTWILLPGSAQFAGRSLSSLQISPNGTIVVGVTRGVRGVSSVSSGGATTTPPVAVPVGLYRSTDAGLSFQFVWDGGPTAATCDTAAEQVAPPCSIRGVNVVRFDPSDPATLYAGAFQIGISRSTDNGVSWTQIKTAVNPTQNTDRPEFDVTKLPNGKTRMYAGIGAAGSPVLARFFRTDDAKTATNASFVDLTTRQVENYCTGQCWYDNIVYTPPGNPDIVYVLGSYDYDTNNIQTNARAVLLSTDAGATFSDMTKDADKNHAEAIHPDQHAIVTLPGNPYFFFNGSDGGVVRSDGQLGDVAYKCDSRGLSPTDLAYCKSLLWRVPNQLISLNDGLSTLQFQSLSASPKNAKNLLQGGTQDNGTFEFTGNTDVWFQEIYGDGGLSGFSPADKKLRFNTFTGQATDVNFRDGDPTKWVIATGPIVSSPEGSYFYPPVTGDPNPTNWGTIFQGSQSVWRTQDWAGDRDFLEANCPEFTTSAGNPACGDFVRIGPTGATDLTAPSYGDRAGGFVAAIERAPSNTGTLWVATGTGRVFVSDNADAPATAVTYTRIDSTSTADPGRFVSSIYVDPANPHHAWISYSGYNFNTPAQPGHVFEVTWNGATATWTNLDGGSGPMGDLPTTDLVRDDPTGTLYASTDFGVMKYDGTSWSVAGTGMPMVEVAGLTIAPDKRLLYAATHGRSAWRLKLDG